VIQEHQAELWRFQQDTDGETWLVSADDRDASQLLVSRAQACFQPFAWIGPIASPAKVIKGTDAVADRERGALVRCRECCRLDWPARVRSR
jgi:hypothetical protein